MPLWGKTDNAANSVGYAVNQFGVTANTGNKTAFFGNTSAWAWNNKQVAGQFGVDSAEVRVGSGNVALGRLSSAGSGYTANATVTFTVTNGGSGAVANAQVGATGRVTAINISTAGSGYKTNPTIAISAPTALNITANTAGVIAATDFILLATANSKFLAGDRLYYGVPASNTAVGGLTGNTYYYVAFANTTGVVLTATSGGSNIDITEARTTATGEVHTFTGDTATGYVAVGGGQNKGATAGWNVRTAGTGGRAGRVQYECLVAMRNITSDASDDSILPDA
jgi:hypothetical protein